MTIVKRLLFTSILGVIKKFASLFIHFSYDTFKSTVIYSKMVMIWNSFPSWTFLVEQKWKLGFSAFLQEFQLNISILSFLRLKICFVMVNVRISSGQRKIILFVKGLYSPNGEEKNKNLLYYDFLRKDKYEYKL